MAIFFRLLSNIDKGNTLKDAIDAVNVGITHSESFLINADAFDKVPGSPFSYWVHNEIRNSFQDLTALGKQQFTACVGLQTSDDFRFIRLWWEVPIHSNYWIPHAKGGEFSEFYTDLHLVVNWKNDGLEIKNFCDLNSGKIISYSRSEQHYFKPGLTWTKSTTLEPSFRCMPAGAIFGVSGLGLIHHRNDQEYLLSLSAIANSKLFKHLLSLSLGLAAEGRKHYEAGIVNKNPLPLFSKDERKHLAQLAKVIWGAKYLLDKFNETSHAFLYPLLVQKCDLYCAKDLANDVIRAFEKIENIVSQAYNISYANYLNDPIERAIDFSHNSGELEIISWCVGVIFGRFDWRLLTGERKLPGDIDPFDPLPSKSPGMVFDGVRFFKKEIEICVDDNSHENDLTLMIGMLLQKLDYLIYFDIKKRICENFFSFHLKQYSKSRRQAPIYWPLQTPSGSYTLWVYYHLLTEQTLYTCINNFVEPKLKSVTDDLNDLRSKPNRSSTEEKELAKLTDLEAELKDFRDELLRIAMFWKPNLNDGVQITAAPLWKLFQHRQWQKKLKETWENLEKGEYDWAHLAYSIWPERVLGKCHTDRSLAIAHDVEDDFWEEIEVPVIRRGKDTEKTKQEWQPRKLSETQVRDLIRQIIETGPSSR